MTAAGNDALLITLLATSTACTGYAAGRLHQWYRTGLDRDEAYRDGYDTATRSVFSLAARLIGARRAIRGTAVVTSAAVVGAPARPKPSVTPPPAGLRPCKPDAPGPGRATPSAAALSAGILNAASPRSRSGGPATAQATPSTTARDTVVGGRHYVPDELVQASTYRLTPDRVARAKVRDAVPTEHKGEETTRLPSVPRPRSS